MKRTVFCFLFAAIFCLSLCGCGAMDTGRDNAVTETPPVSQTTPEVLPETEPVVTPNVEDGIVKDRDGKIDEQDTGLAEPSEGTEGIKTPSSPGPAAGSKP